jgi:hypothetical protein
VNFPPHRHALVTDGAFGPTGWFIAFAKIALYTLEHLFRHRVLQMLLRARRIDEPVIRKRPAWRHSGFSLHTAVRIGSDDTEGRRALSEYILRSPFSQETLRYQAKTGSIIDRPKRHPVLKRNCEVCSACDWLAALTAPIPNAGEHLGRDSGGYSTVSRGKRRKAPGEATTAIVESSERSPSEAKRAWARLITQVYEVDRLVCPKCAGAMRILACIEQPAVIEKSLTHLGLWTTQAHSPPAAGRRSVTRSLPRTRGRPPGLAPPWGSGSARRPAGSCRGPPRLCLSALDTRDRCAGYSPRPGGAVWRHA